MIISFMIFFLRWIPALLEGELRQELRKEFLLFFLFGLQQLLQLVSLQLIAILQDELVYFQQVL